MIFNQCGLCKICGDIFEDENKIFVDHNHINNNVRGLLCPTCNTGLGMFKDSCKILNLAINYLEEN